MDDDDDGAASQAARAQRKPKKKLEKDIEKEMGDDYILDLKKTFDLPDDEKYDRPVEMWNGHNVADFIDTNIVQKLAMLREEERLREQAGVYDSDMESDTDERRECARLARQIRHKQLIGRQHTLRKKMSTKPVMPRRGRKRERSATRLESELADLGVRVEAKRMRHLRSASAARNAHKNVRVGRSPSASHSMTRPPPRNEQGVTKKLVGKVKKIERSSQVPRQRLARKGEGDHHIGTKMPKHLFSGKRTGGKTDRR